MPFDSGVGLGGNALLRPSSSKQIQGTNYVPTNDYEDQFLPEVMGEEVQRFGPRPMHLTSILEKTSAMKPFAASEVKWAEQNRLHTLYNNVTLAASGNIFTVRTQDGNRTAGAVNHNIRVGATIILQDGAGAIEKGVVTAVTATTFTALSSENTAATGWQLARVNDATAANSVIRMYVYGSDFGKGTFGMAGSQEADPEIYTVTPIIFKDHYKINGSDTAQIGWIEGITEDGTTGYLWFLKSKSETMLRWKDYLEMGLIEGVPGTGNASAGHTSRLEGTTEDDGSFNNNVVGGNGVQGLFYQIQQRGHEFDDFFTTAGTSTGNIQADTDIEQIILALEEQAAISSYTWWVNRQTDLNIDKWLASKNNFGGQVGTTGTLGAATPNVAAQYYGEFANTADKMLDFGFKGFSWGGYNFMKTDWRYLNDPTLRGAITNDITGIMLPAGTTTVYDMNLGKNAVNPFVYVAYRANEVDNRMNKEWITGSIGVYTDTEDALKCHFLSERALVVQAANNMVLLN